MIGKSLSGAVSAMLIMSILTNLGVFPSGQIAFVGALQTFVVRLATPLLLLGADLNVVKRNTGSMLTAFLIGKSAFFC